MPRYVERSKGLAAERTKREVKAKPKYVPAPCPGFAAGPKTKKFVKKKPGAKNKPGPKPGPKPGATAAGAASLARRVPTLHFFGQG